MDPLPTSHKWLLNTEDYSACLSLRFEVFRDEQKFDSDLEIDEYDSKDNVETKNLLIFNSLTSEPMATARLIKKESGKWYMGRVCVKKIYRGLGLGKLLIELTERKAKEMEVQELRVSSQLYIRSLYEKMEFKAVGEVYLDENVEHITLVKRI